jgi:hypothetical protein
MPEHVLVMKSFPPLLLAVFLGFPGHMFGMVGVMIRNVAHLLGRCTGELNIPPYALATCTVQYV